MSDYLRFLNIRQFCERMSMSKEKAYAMLRSGRVKGIRLSDGPRAGWRIPITELKRLHSEAYEGEEE